MTLRPIALSLTSTLVGAALVLSLQASAQHQMPGHSMPMGGAKVSSDAEPGVAALYKEMMSPMPLTRATSPNTDRAFAQLMEMHHASGVRMAKVELKYGDDPKARALAASIVKTQSAEIVRLQKLARTAR
ncbi:DUF305 domain-containing protein [bacterium]|nr:MAG: DUF305 domain-containing protein [bacterium]